MLRGYCTTYLEIYYCIPGYLWKGISINSELVFEIALHDTLYIIGYKEPHNDM